MWRRTCFGCLASIAFLAGVVSAQEKALGKVVADYWDAAYLRGEHAGYAHTQVRQVEERGRTILRTTMVLHLTVRRFRDTIQLHMETGTDETPEGEVVGTFLRHHLGGNKSLTIRGIVEGPQLRLIQDDRMLLHPAPWRKEVLGLYRQLTLFRDKKVQPGDRFSFWSFEPSINLVVRVAVRVGDYEEIPLTGGRRQRLLRVELTPEKIEQVTLPTLVQWLNAENLPVRAQFEVPGLGLLTLVRTTQQEALTPARSSQLADIGLDNFVPLRRRIPHPYQQRYLIYRITVKGDEDPASTFAQDDRQQVRNIQGQTFELHVRASAPPAEEVAEKNPGDEFLQSSYFITSADPRVRELARQAVGAEKDPWRKAVRIERWVHGHMRTRNDQDLVPADQVARTLQGDCTEYAMLTAAMCRAAGIPSRTAIGLIYVDAPRGPAFAFHMWTEVWVRGRWVPLDATLGQGFVGATHLKISAHSWHNTYDFSPLLPLFRILGKLTIEVVGSAGG